MKPWNELDGPLAIHTEQLTRNLQTGVLVLSVVLTAV